MRKKCPKCNEVTEVKKIVYGLPAEDFDFQKYESGGCCIEDDSPTHFCTKCNQSFRSNRKNHNLIDSPKIVLND
jgi:hypothetical protein